MSDKVFGPNAQVAAQSVVGELAIDLKSIDAKLCAKGYGMFGTGDRRSMSGEVRFAFDWTLTPATGNLRTGRMLVTVKLKKSEGQPVEAVLPLALGMLRQQIDAIAQ